ncbi:MUL1A ligase, partial [Polypterus senegalus]
MSDNKYASLALLCFGGSLALSGLFYNLYRKKREEVQKLKEIPKVELNEDLINSIESLQPKQINYVAVEGIVLPDGEMLTSHYVPTCYGVIQKSIVQQNKKVFNKITNTWLVVPKMKNLQETIKTVPFSLAANSDYDTRVSVHVESPLTAMGFSLELVHSRLRFKDYFGHLLNMEKPWWLEEKEEMLKVGSTLTGFGELVLDSNRVLRLRPPMDGNKYMLIISDYWSYLKQQESSVMLCKVLTAVFGMTAALSSLCFLIGSAMRPEVTGLIRMA